MKIKYETTLEEAVDCEVRFWWLRKSSIREITFNLLLIPVACFALSYFLNFHLKKTIIGSLSLIIIFGSYYLYAYTKGLRNNAKKKLLESLDGKAYPNEIEFELLEDGIITKNSLYEIKIPWSSIIDIRLYKQYVELKGTACLVQIKKEYVKSLDDIISIWNKAR